MPWNRLMYDDKTLCVSTGRNGDFNTTGIDIDTRLNRTTGKEAVSLSGVTTKGVTARGNIELPREQVADFIEKLFEFLPGDDSLTPGAEHYFYSLYAWKHHVNSGETVLSYAQWVRTRVAETTLRLAELEARVAKADDGASEMTNELELLRGALDPDYIDAATLAQD